MCGALFLILGRREPRFHIFSGMCMSVQQGNIFLQGRLRLLISGLPNCSNDCPPILNEEQSTAYSCPYLIKLLVNPGGRFRARLGYFPDGCEPIAPTEVAVSEVAIELGAVSVCTVVQRLFKADEM